jgi:hypothetical protein
MKILLDAGADAAVPTLHQQQTYALHLLCRVTLPSEAVRPLFDGVIQLLIAKGASLTQGARKLSHCC